MSNEIEKIDIAIVGGGIVGLWSAYYILKKFPSLSVVVFEAEKYLGEHTTGRNSEVLHSGIYYPTGSMKHVHCVSGNLLWREYISKKALPFLSCGKIVCATSQQKEKLEALYQQSQNNGIQEVRRLTAREIEDYKRILHVDAGLFCGTSGVLNVAESLHALRNDVEHMGGVVLTSSRVSLLEQSSNDFLLSVPGGQIRAAVLVNAAGLFALDFRKNFELADFENFYVKGSYLKLMKKIAVDKLIYPLPPAHGLGLGVHLTLDTSGDQKFGPNTEAVNQIHYGIDETLVDKMLPTISDIFKTVRAEDLQLGYAGVRPKVKKNNELMVDFIFQTKADHGIKGYFEFLGIESPGVTAAPSLALELVKAL